MSPAGIVRGVGWHENLDSGEIGSHTLPVRNPPLHNETIEHKSALTLSPKQAYVDWLESHVPAHPLGWSAQQQLDADESVAWIIPSIGSFESEEAFQTFLSSIKPALLRSELEGSLLAVTQWPELSEATFDAFFELHAHQHVASIKHLNPLPAQESSHCAPPVKRGATTVASILLLMSASFFIARIIWENLTLMDAMRKHVVILEPMWYIGGFAINVASFYSAVALRRLLRHRRFLPVLLLGVVVFFAGPISYRVTMSYQINVFGWVYYGSLGIHFAILIALLARDCTQLFRFCRGGSAAEPEHVV